MVSKPFSAARLSILLVLVVLWALPLTPPAAASGTDDACTNNHFVNLAETDSVDSNTDPVDFWTGTGNPGDIEVWTVTPLSTDTGDWIHLTVYSGSCSNAGIVCTANSSLAPGFAPSVAAVCVANGPTWARVWYQGDGGTVGYVITHVVI